MTFTSFSLKHQYMFITRRQTQEDHLLCLTTRKSHHQRIVSKTAVDLRVAGCEPQA
jgi:hypothetical protein